MSPPDGRSARNRAPARRVEPCPGRAGTKLGIPALLLACVAWSVQAETDADGARELARCAAFYFNGAKVRPMREYDAWYAAGERAFNDAVRVLDRGVVDRLMADAAIEMTALMGEDLRNFKRVEASLRPGCDALLGIDER